MHTRSLWYLQFLAEHFCSTRDENRQHAATQCNDIKMYVRNYCLCIQERYRLTTREMLKPKQLHNREK